VALCKSADEVVKEELVSFLLGQCRERKLSLRKLSMNSGLSPSTVHNIIRRRYKPTIYSLNHIADYLGVERELLWQLAGLVSDSNPPSGDDFVDTRLKSHFLQVAKLPESSRSMVISIIGALLAFLNNDAN